MFEAARMHIDATYTTQAGEAVGICQQLDRERYDVVVPCSGDGLPHEVFNGLGRRADARAALRQLAVAHIPGGSGNAMSCNLNGSFRPGPAALAIVKGVRTPLDMMSVTQGEGTEDAPVRRTLSFLSQSVGIVAESDLGTENMRWMGPHRFTVGVAQRIFSKKVYPCDVALKVAVPDKDAVRAHYRREKEAHEANPGVRRESGAADASADSVDSSEVDVSEGLPPLRYGSINDKVPDDWEKLSLDKMGNFYCGNVSSSLLITLKSGENICLTLLSLPDAVHGARRELLPGNDAERRADGPGDQRRRHPRAAVPRADDVDREGAVLRQPASRVPESDGVPHHAAATRRHRRLYQHRRRAHPLRALPGRGPPGPRHRPVTPRQVRG